MLFGLRFLRLLGRHSLQIYAWHVVLVYLVRWLDGEVGPFNEATKTAIAIGGVGAARRFPRSIASGGAPGGRGWSSTGA